MSLWSQQHQHFSFFYPLIRIEHTSAADLYLEDSRSSKVQRVTSYKAGMMLCCCPRWWCGLPCAVITSPRCRDQLFRPGLIWLLSESQTFSSIHQHNTTLEVCKQSVFRFIQFRAESARSAKSGNTVTVTPELCSGQKWHFSSLSSVWGPEWGTRDTWRLCRTRAKSCT